MRNMKDLSSLTSAGGISKGEQLSPSQLSRLAHFFLRNKAALFGLVVTILFILIAIIGPSITPYDPFKGRVVERLKPPSEAHWFGTDTAGRDLLTRVIYGARISIWIGLSSTALAMAGGILIGLLAGYYGGWVDTLFMRFMDLVLTFPALVLAIALVNVLGSGVTSVIIAVTVSMVPVFARLVRALVIAIKESEFITAARCLGATHNRIMFSHLLPNIWGPIIVQATIAVGTAVLTASALSFLGLGVQPPEPEWGSMLSQAREYIQYAPHYIIFPGAALSLFILGFNLLGDGLRDLLDPRLRKAV